MWVITSKGNFINQNNSNVGCIDVNGDIYYDENFYSVIGLFPIGNVSINGEVFSNIGMNIGFININGELFDIGMNQIAFINNSSILINADRESICKIQNFIEININEIPFLYRGLAGWFFLIYKIYY